MADQSTKTNNHNRILVIDDDRDMLELIKMTLESAEGLDIEVVTKKDAESGLDTLKSNSFDMVLTDQRMPGMNGLEMLSIIREKHPDIIRVLITAYSELELAKDAINKAKVDLYLEKPWSKDDIREKIKKELEIFESLKDDEVVLKDGNSYLFKERKPDVLYQSGLKRIGSLGEGMIISRTDPKKMEKMYDLQNWDVKYYWLSKIDVKNTLDPVDLELIADLMIRYFEDGGKTVILDCVDSLLKDNSFKRFEGFIDNIVDVASMEDGTFLTGLDPRIISERELASLERKMISLSFSGENR
ncbi:MAG: response regulator [Thermoplasmatota archaeon]